MAYGVIVRPADPMSGEEVEHSAVGRPVERVGELVRREPVRGAGNEEPTVRERRTETRREPPVRERERGRQSRIERKVLTRPIAHRDVRLDCGAELGDSTLSALHETLIGPTRPL